MAKNKAIFEQIKRPLNPQTQKDEFDKLYQAAKINSQQKSREFSNYSDLEWRKNVLKEKARESLGFTFEGQEFNGKSIFVEHENLAKKTYLDKSTEPKGRLKEAAKEEMKSRGVYEKPDIEKPNETGKKLNTESSSKVLKMMKEQKIYEKLSEK